MATVAARAVDSDRVLARVRSRRIERDFAALVTVKSVGGPCRLIPAVLEALGDLGERRSGEQCKSEESTFVEHCCG